MINGGLEGFLRLVGLTQCHKVACHDAIEFNRLTLWNHEIEMVVSMLFHHIERRKDDLDGAFVVALVTKSRGIP